MSFIETYERQLVEAAERRYRRRSRRFVSRHRRGLAVAVAALAVAGPATAAVTEWNPFDNPNRPTVSRSPVDPALRAQLGVLRGPQTPADRSAITRERLRSVDSSFRGAQIGAIRVLDPETGVVLAPFKERPVPRDPQGRPLPGFDGADFRNVACVFQPTPDGFAAAGCYSAGAIADGRAIGSGGGQVDGLVPDGVARVRLTRGGSETADVAVRNNYFGAESPFPDAVEWLGPDGAAIKRIETR